MPISRRFLIPAVAGLCSVGGFFLRFFQRKNELMSDGSLAEGAYLHVVLLILSLLLAVASIVLICKLTPKTNWSQLNNLKLMPIMPLVAAAALLFSNIVILFNGTPPASPYSSSAPAFSNFLSNLLPPLGILAAICVAFFSYKCIQNQKPSASLYMLFSLYLVIRLIVRFQAWNTDPSIHDYCYALLGTISAMLAAFHMAGFSFNKGKSRMSLFWIVCALYFCSITLADAVYDRSLSEILFNAALLFAFSFNLDQILRPSETAQ